VEDHSWVNSAGRLDHANVNVCPNRSQEQTPPGAARYTVTFAAGQTPPVNGFWSLTIYNKEHLFAPNPLNRFSLGTKSKSMKQNSDGSLTLYFQNESPGADGESNWVPTPADEFSLFIRAYWPKSQRLVATAIGKKGELGAKRAMSAVWHKAEVLRCPLLVRSPGQSRPGRDN
jgi:hypothetical protein